ncbi:MAG TPA: hypothetical protein VKH81_24410 [Candidatus Angelobacter sp.]|nr:hypothetical protein [Candidatus Angelobacter sp.]
MGIPKTITVKRFSAAPLSYQRSSAPIRGSRCFSDAGDYGDYGDFAAASPIRDHPRISAVAFAFPMPAIPRDFGDHGDPKTTLSPIAGFAINKPLS